MNYMETYAYRPTGELQEILAQLEEAGFGNTVETVYLRGLLETRRPGHPPAPPRRPPPPAPRGSYRPQRRQERAAARRAAALELRRQGMSYRAIAERLDTSEATIRRALATAPADATPERIAGMNGRSYRARRTAAAGIQGCEPAGRDPHPPTPGPVRDWTRAWPRNSRKRRPGTRRRRAGPVRFGEEPARNPSTRAIAAATGTSHQTTLRDRASEEEHPPPEEPRSVKPGLTRKSVPGGHPAPSAARPQNGRERPHLAAAASPLRAGNRHSPATRSLGGSRRCRPSTRPPAPAPPPPAPAGHAAPSTRPPPSPTAIARTERPSPPLAARYRRPPTRQEAPRWEGSLPSPASLR